MTEVAEDVGVRKKITSFMSDLQVGMEPYPEIWDLNDVVVLIVCDDGDDCRPVASHVVDHKFNLAPINVHIRLRLKIKQFKVKFNELITKLF